MAMIGKIREKRNLLLIVIFAAMLLFLLTPTLRVPGASQIGEMLVESGMAGVFRLAHA